MLSHQEILEAIQLLPPSERLQVIKDALDSLGKDFRELKPRSSKTLQKKKLAQAAQLVLNDYNNDKELTAFTAIDGDDFYV